MTLQPSDSRVGTSSARVTYRFGEFEVDLAAYEVRRSGHRIRLARQPMDLLLLLLERRQELVSREDTANLEGPPARSAFRVFLQRVSWGFADSQPSRPAAVSQAVAD